MHKYLTKILLTLGVLATCTAPAFADWYDYHRTREYWGRPGPGVVVVEPQAIYAAPPVYIAPPPPPPPVVVYNTQQPYVRVRCDNSSAITGTVIGGVAGGLIGNQFGHHRGLPTVGGALVGAILGNEIGRANETCAAEALEYAKPNTQVVWNDNGAQYVVQPTKTFQQDGQYCREYQTKMVIGGQVQQGYGTACRQPDGSWQEEN